MFSDLGHANCRRDPGACGAMSNDKALITKAQASGREVHPALAGRTSGTLLGRVWDMAERFARRKIHFVCFMHLLFLIMTNHKALMTKEAPKYQVIGT